MKSRISVTAVLLVAVLAPAPTGQSIPGSRLEGLDLFRSWLDLARTHAPGQIDEPVKALRSFSLAQLAELKADLQTFIEFLKKPGLDRPRPPARAYSSVELTLLGQMASAEATNRSPNTLLRQIALLHADAMALPGAVTYVIDPDPANRGADVTMVQDGIGMGGARTPPLWPIARSAIEAIQPKPAVDTWSRQWYQATTSYLFYSFQLGALPAHLAAYRSQIPDDEGAVFGMGCLYEAFGGQRVQATVRSERAQGITLDVPDPVAAFTRARREFDEVLARNPWHVEAKVRRARVIHQLGDARAAVDDLTRLTSGTEGDKDVRYLAFLFLAEARWSLGEAGTAAEAYEAAMRLYPGAQSAAVGLMFVKPRALESDGPRIEAVLRAPASARIDPWLDYHLGPGRRAPAQMEILWHALIAR